MKFSSESPPLAIESIAAGVHRRPMVGATYAPTTNKVVPYLVELLRLLIVVEGRRLVVLLGGEGLQKPILYIS